LDLSQELVFNFGSSPGITANSLSSQASADTTTYL
jgi:hypothetical protein